MQGSRKLPLGRHEKKYRPTRFGQNLSILDIFLILLQRSTQPYYDRIIIKLHFVNSSKNCLLFQLPEYVWSEEYQVAILSEHFKAFDRLRQAGFFAGEFIWNFADFKTAQSKLLSIHSIDKVPGIVASDCIRSSLTLSYQDLRNLS